MGQDQPMDKDMDDMAAKQDNTMMSEEERQRLLQQDMSDKDTMEGEEPKKSM